MDKKTDKEQKNEMLSTLKEVELEIDLEETIDITTRKKIMAGIVLHGDNERIIESQMGIYKEKMKKKEELEKELEEHCKKTESPHELAERIRKNCKKLELKKELEKETNKLHAEITVTGLYNEGLIVLVKTVVNSEELEERGKIIEWIKNDESEWGEWIKKKGGEWDKLISRTEGGKDMIDIIYYHRTMKKLIKELEENRDNYGDAVKRIIKEREKVPIKEEDWKKAQEKIRKKERSNEEKERKVIRERNKCR
jgi:hypothetical protein